MCVRVCLSVCLCRVQSHGWNPRAIVLVSNGIHDMLYAGLDAFRENEPRLYTQLAEFRNKTGARILVFPLCCEPS